MYTMMDSITMNVGVPIRLCHVMVRNEHDDGCITVNVGVRVRQCRIMVRNVNDDGWRYSECWCACKVMSCNRSMHDNG